MLDFINDDYITVPTTNIWDLSTDIPKWINGITDQIINYYKLNTVADGFDKIDFFFSAVGYDESSIGKQLFQEFLKKNDIAFEEYNIVAVTYPREHRTRGYVFKVTPALTDLMLKYS